MEGWVEKVKGLTQNNDNEKHRLTDTDSFLVASWLSFRTQPGEASQRLYPHLGPVGTRSCLAC